MQIRIKLYLLLITLFTFSYAQKLLLTDQSTGRPVPDAYIYHESKANLAQSNAEGEVSLDDFQHGTLFIQHPSYHSHSVMFSGVDIHLALKEKIISYDEVVVSANKWEQQEENISQEIVTVNRREIALENPQTSADLLASSGQVFLQKSQLGGGSPKLRGFAANAVLLVIDGVRMNNAIFRGGNLQNVINIDPNAIESTEIVFGPGSVIYGSDALGGVMDFHTIDPTWGLSGTIVKANGLARYSSAANEKTGHIDFSVATKKFTFFQSLSYSDFDDLRAGAFRTRKYKGEFERNFYAERVDDADQLVPNEDVNLQRFSGYELFNSISKTKFRINNNMDLGYSFYYSTTSDIPRYDRLVEPISPENDSLVNTEWYYGPQKWQMHKLQFNHYQTRSFYNQLKVTGAFQQFEESRQDRKFGSNRFRSRSEQVDMYSLAVDLDKEMNQGNLYYGVDFYYNDVKSSAFARDILTQEETPTDTRYPDGGSSYLSAAIYASYVHRFNDAFSLNGGTRFNYVELNASTLRDTIHNNLDRDFDLNNGALTWSVGLVYNINEENILRYNVSTGFRAPNVDDVGKLFELNDDVIIVPNPDLKPEHSFSNELGYELKKERMLISITGFYSRLKDAIVRGDYVVPNTSSYQNQTIRAQINAGEAEIYGGSLAIQAELGDFFALKSTLSYTDGRDLTNEQPLRHATPLFGRSSIIHKVNKFRTECYIEYNSSRRPSQIPDSEFVDKYYLYTDEGSPAWYTLNLKSSFHINEHVTLNAGIENILNHHYRPYTSGISAPGRNFIVALRGTI